MRDIKDIKVSLVVAIYRSAPFMEKLMYSILNQTHKNIEVILVDDGSPDDSGLICDQYAAKDNRIVVIHKNNGGVCDARNKGMEAMTGEYFSVIDGDDWLELDYTEYLLSLAVSVNADMALSDSVFTSRDTKQNTEDNIEMWTPEQMAEYIIYPKMPIGPWNKLYKVSFIREHELGYNTCMSGETPYFITMVAGCNPVIIKGHRRVYNYRMNNANSALTSRAVIYGKNALYNIKNVKHITKIRTPRHLAVIDWHIYRNYHFLLKLIIATNTYKENHKALIECLLMIRLKFPFSFWNVRNDYSNHQKWSLFKHALFPIRYAKKGLIAEEKALREDINLNYDSNKRLR